MAGELFVVALMGMLCALFVFMLVRTIRNQAVGIKSLWRIVRIIVFAVCALWFGYVFVSLLVVLPRILAG